MANYNDLKTGIDAVIKTNGRHEISGAALNTQLKNMIAELGAGYQYMGVATPATNPGTAQTPDYKCFYLATTPGTYTNLGGLVVADGEVAILKYDTSWTKEVTGIATAESVSQLGQEVIYDVTKNNPTAGPNNDGKFESLSALLSDANLSTLIPIAVRCGGMSIRFVQTSDNKYVQHRLTSDGWSINPEDWALCDDSVLVENPEFVAVFTDNTGKVLFGSKIDGDFYFGKGCPKQVKEYVLYHKEEILSLLADKVDKAEGKGLIQIEVAENNFFIENPEYYDIETDSDGKILEAVTGDGRKKVNIPIDTPSASYDSCNNPEWMDVVLDRKDNIIEGITKHGEKVIPKLKSPVIDNLKKDIQFQQHFNKIYPHTAIVSFIDDDSGRYIPEVWGEIIERTGIRMGIACIAGAMAGEVVVPTVYEQMTIEELRDYYNNGNEVYSHSWSHPSFRITTDLDVIEEECRKSRDWLNANGFTRNSDIIVYPSGVNDDQILDAKLSVIRRNYRYGVATSFNGEVINSEPIKDLLIIRCNADANPLSYLKKCVDKAVSENRLLVVMTHAYELMGYGVSSLSTDKDVNIQRVVDMIEYAQNQGATILPLEEAIHQIYGWH